MEIKIIASVIGDRAHWELVSPHITPSSDLTQEGAMIWEVIRKYYARDEAAKSADFEVVQKRVLRRVEHNAKHLDMMSAYLDRIRLIDVSATNIVEEVLEQKRTRIGLALADALIAKNQPSIVELMDELSKLNASVDLDIGVDESYQGTDLDELLEAFSDENLIRVAPRTLNDHLGGGALPGHHILVAAMPEVGKSLFAIHMAAGFVGQDKKVLYIGNEDPIVALVLRFLCNLTGMTKYEIIADREKARDLADKRGYGRAVFVGLSPGSIPEIRSLIVKHKPDVLIVDQLRNVSAAKAENRTNQLEAVARAMRDFARQYHMLVVSVTQAAESARSRLKLNMGDIDGSNIGMPGACDVMLMIGMNDHYYEANQRHLSLAKNKLTGDHGEWVVNINKQTSRIIDELELVKKVQAKRVIS